jgi:membrane protein
MANGETLPEIRELNRPSAVLRHIRLTLATDARKFWELLSATIDEWFRDNAGRLGAALAFYTVFSLAPLLVVVVGVAGLVLERAEVQLYILEQMREMIGPEGAQAIGNVLTTVHRPGGGLRATIIGLVTLFFGASMMVGELRNALNTIWEVPQAEGVSLLQSLVGTLRNRFFAFMMVLGIGFLLLISLVANAWLAAMGNYVQGFIGIAPELLQAANFVIWFLVSTLLFGLIYKVLPDVQIAWSDVVVGAIVTSLLFTLGKTLIGWYLGASAIGSAYGAAGSLAILLAWVYYSAQVFFLGAEFTQVYANRYGSRLVARVLAKNQKQSKKQAGPDVTPEGKPAGQAEQ